MIGLGAGLFSITVLPFIYMFGGPEFTRPTGEQVGAVLGGWVGAYFLFLLVRIVVRDNRHQREPEHQLGICDC